MTPRRSPPPPLLLLLLLLALVAGTARAVLPASGPSHQWVVHVPAGAAAARAAAAALGLAFHGPVRARRFLPAAVSGGSCLAPCPAGGGGVNTGRWVRCAIASTWRCRATRRASTTAACRRRPTPGGTPHASAGTRRLPAALFLSFSRSRLRAHASAGTRLQRRRTSSCGRARGGTLSAPCATATPPLATNGTW
jgi:hypothetical protein